MKRSVSKSPAPTLAAAVFLAAAPLVFLPAPSSADPSLEWEHLYDGGSRQADTGLAALSDPEGNPVIAGEVTDAAGNGNLLIRKLERASGDEIWTRSVLGTADNRLALGGMVWDGHGELLIGGTRLGCYG
jgi:hypothetical protein